MRTLLRSWFGGSKTWLAVGLALVAVTGWTLAGWAADPEAKDKAAEKAKDGEKKDGEKKDDAKGDSENLDDEDRPRENPYLAPAGMSKEDLEKYLEKLQSKPKTIRDRPEYIQAIADTTQRILAAKGDDKTGAATLAMFDALLKLSKSGQGAEYEKLIELAKKHQDDARANVATEAKLLLLEQKVEGVNYDDKKALPAVLDEIRKFFKAQEKLGERHLALASGSVKIINSLDKNEDLAAAAAYRELGEQFAKSEHDRLAKYGRDLQKMANKIELMIKPVEIAGALIDGAPFDWSKYKGKVVLIDFWATWCGPCVAEVPNLKQQYEQFHPRGFEIVGISLDEDVEAVKTFLKEKEITWATLISTDKETAGPKHPMATKFNVTAIPTMLLVGKDGKIVATNARGEELGRQLAKLLGDDAEKPVGDKPAEEKKPAEAKPEKPADKPAVEKVLD